LAARLARAKPPRLRAGTARGCPGSRSHPLDLAELHFLGAFEQDAMAVRGVPVLGIGGSEKLGPQPNGWVIAPSS